MDDTRTGRLEVVSDAICPWCWVGKRNLEGALAILPSSVGIRRLFSLAM